jgi:hypothetical protein
MLRLHVMPPREKNNKDIVQAASQGAIHGTSSRKESDNALGRVVV